MQIMTHVSMDWCHLCGKRSTPLADIWYPKNAEHSGADSEYIRICISCGQLIVNVGKDPGVA